MSSPGAAHPVSARFADRLRIRAREEEVPVADRVTFPELVWAHFLREQELSQGHLHGQAAEEYRVQLERFVKEHGCLVNAYWCTSEASAVALTEKPGKRIAGFLWRRPSDMRLHSATDWVTKDSPDIAHQLHTGETLGIRVSEVLAETSERIAMQWILSVSGYLLGIVDKAEGKPSQHETSVAVKRSRTELAKVEGYYDRAGEKSGRLEYFKGMMLGVIALGVLAVAGAAVWSLIADFHLKDDNTQTFFACYAMGAIGAMVSVMARMASSKEDAFNLDYEVGRRSIRRVGSFRPVIGAIFAVVLYLALRGGLIQLQTTSGGNDTTFFYAALAFIAGFSERRTQILLGGAERVLSDGDEHDEEKETAPKEVTRRRKQAATTGSTG